MKELKYVFEFATTVLLEIEGVESIFMKGTDPRVSIFVSNYCILLLLFIYSCIYIHIYKCKFKFKFKRKTIY